MKRLKQIVLLVAAITVLAASAAYAAIGPTPAEIAADLSGQSVTDVMQERAQGKSYGAIAGEAGKLDEFKAQMLKHKEAVLDQSVAEGRITRDRADAIYSHLQENQANCNCSKDARIGQGAGLGFGHGHGKCSGHGKGTCERSQGGYGSGSGTGQGFSR